MVFFGFFKPKKYTLSNFLNFFKTIKSSKINNLLKLIAHNYDSKIFFYNLEEDYNTLNNNLKFEILFNLKDYDKSFDLFIKLKNTSYLNYILNPPEVQLILN